MFGRFGDELFSGSLIIDIINEVPYVYYDPNTTVASASAISYNSEVIRYEDVQIVDNRITIVAKIF